MTTIAIRAGIIAFDSKIADSDGVIHSSGINKVWKSETHEAYYAVAGFYTRGVEAGRLMDKRKKLPWDSKRKSEPVLPANEDTDFFVIVPGHVYECDDCGWHEIKAEFTAIGSGAKAALAAMHMGATAEKAVEIACLVDNGSGPPVHTINLRRIG